MTETKKPKPRMPRAITILDYVIQMQASDALKDEDPISELKNQLMLKVAQEARRR